MRFTIDGAQLKAGLERVKHTVPNRAERPILGHILMETDDERLKLTASDLSTTITTWVETQKIERTGRVTLPAKQLVALVSMLPDAPISLNYDQRSKRDPRIHISGSRTDTRFCYIDPVDFPDLPDVEEDIRIEVAAAAFREALAKTLFCTAPGSEKPVLHSLLLDFTDDLFCAVSADGVRMAVFEGMTISRLPMEALRRDEEGHLKLLVPKPAAEQLLRLARHSTDPVTIGVPKKRTHAAFDVGAAQVVTKLVSEKFPAYRTILPDEPSTSVEIDSRTLNAAAHTASTFSDPHGLSTMRMMLNAENSVVTVHSGTSESGGNTGEIDAKIEGDAEGICFQAAFVRDAMRVFRGTVSLKIESPRSPAVFSLVEPEEGRRLTHVLMPVYDNAFSQ